MHAALFGAPRFVGYLQITDVTGSRQCWQDVAQDARCKLFAKRFSNRNTLKSLSRCVATPLPPPVTPYLLLLLFVI